jgi:hypothetical protein
VTDIFDWRAHLKVHPAADLFPLMSEVDPEGFAKLAEDIKTNGLRVPIDGWMSSEGEFLLDGRNRLDAMALLGLLFETADHHLGAHRWRNGKWSMDGAERINFGHGHSNRSSAGDPHALVLSLNLHRRHLTPERRRELIAALLKMKPEASNSSIAKQVKADDKVVDSVRRELEANSDIPNKPDRVEASGRKARGRKPAKKAKPSARSAMRKIVAKYTTKEAPAEAGAERRKAEYAAQEANTAPIDPGSRAAVVHDAWRAFAHALENLTRHPPAKIAESIPPEAASLITEAVGILNDVAARMAPAVSGTDLDIPDFLQRPGAPQPDQHPIGH